MASLFDKLRNRPGRLRTYLAIAETLATSTEIVARSAIGRLDAQGQHIAERWANRIIRISGIQLQGIGVENIAFDRSQIFMSNHRSLLDVPSVISLAPCRVRAISKLELRSVPIFGKAIGAAGNIFVDRKNLEGAKAQLAQAAQLLETKTSLWVAAEGTRAKTDTLLPMKMGGFHVAIDLGLPIVPTWIEGTDAVLPSGTFKAQPGLPVTVSFGAPIDASAYEKSEVRQLARRVRDVLVKLSGRPDPFPQDCTPPTEGANTHSSDESSHV